MDKSRCITKFLSKNCLSVVFVSVLLLATVLAGVAPAQVSEADKQKIVRQVAQKWIQVGTEQYGRGFFKAAQQSLLRAQEYQGYLTATEREKLTELLEKTDIAVLQRERILEHIQTADKQVEQGQLIKAKANLEKVKDSDFLTEAERQLITEGVKKIDNQLEGQKKEIIELYNRSVGFYRAGQLEKAYEGFIKVAESRFPIAPPGESAEDYLAKIDNILGRPVRPSVPTEGEPEKKLPEITVPAIEEELLGVEAEPTMKAEPQVIREPEIEPVTDEGSYIEMVNRRRNIRRRYTRTVVSDANDKARSYISGGEFDKAKEEIEIAERTVNEYQLDLGDELFRQYSSQLKQLTEERNQRKGERSQRLEEKKRLEAIEAQRQFRSQMEADRKKRVEELMEHAMAYQKQQRYEEALGQLESLLVVEPLNDDALILKQTLEDMIGFRKQLEVQKEKSRERVDILRKTDEAAIPYAEEITYPKDWREIVASPFRKPEPPIGLDPADVDVYKQLAEIVDLLELSRDMPFSSAIDRLKNAVYPPLKIFVNWRDLYESSAIIEPTTPINMDPLSAVPLGAALDRLLDAVSGGLADIRYVVENGIITVATIESLPSKLETRVYDVTDLLGRPANYYQMGGMGMGGYSAFMGINPMMGMGGGFNHMMGMSGGGLGSFYPQPSTYGPPQSMPSMGGYPTPPQSSPFGGAMRGYYA